MEPKLVYMVTVDGVVLAARFDRLEARKAYNNYREQSENVEDFDAHHQLISIEVF